MTKELIEEVKKVVVPFMVHKLKQINYEGLGEVDAKEFEKDFNEILGLAIKSLEQEPRKGHWIAQNDDCNDWYECSECGYGSEGEMQFNSEHDVRTNYCPYCGADMREVEEWK